VSALCYTGGLPRGGPCVDTGGGGLPVVIIVVPTHAQNKAKLAKKQVS
jgi:hypothetical protein